MKCQRCKEREATVQIMQQIGGKKAQTFYLCEVCARELGITMPAFPKIGKMTTNPFAAMGNVFQSNFGFGADEINTKQTERCTQCGLTFEDFRKSGYLGCPGCYEAFAHLLDPVFVRTQMGKKHMGRKLAHKSDKGVGEDKEKRLSGADVTMRTKSESEAAVSGQVPASGAKKRKAAAKAQVPVISAEESEELIALEKQHLENLLKEKKEALAKAVSAEDYMTAARIRDEIADLTRKKVG